MVRAGFPVTDNMERELEGDCLVGTGSVEQWYRRADGLEVKIVERVVQSTQEIGDRFSVHVGSAANLAVSLYALFPVKLVAIRNFLNGKDTAVVKFKAFLTAVIQVEDIVFREKVPALGQRALVRVSAVGPDIALGAFFASNVLEHGIDSVIYPLAGFLNQVGDIIDFEKFLRVDLAIPGILVVDISEITMVYGQALTFAAVSLKSNVVDVDLLDRCCALNFDDVPLVPVRRSQDINPGIDSASQYAGLEEWLPFIQKLLGCCNVTHEVISGDVNSLGEELLGQLADKVPLVEYELGSKVDLGESFGIVDF